MEMKLRQFRSRARDNRGSANELTCSHDTPAEDAQAMGSIQQTVE